MIVNGKPYQSIWTDPSNDEVVMIINQHLLPFEFRIDEISSSAQVMEAIRTMKVRGAPLIGICGAFGIYMACLEAKHKKDGEKYISEYAEMLKSARPTAVNLAWAVDRVMQKTAGVENPEEKIRGAREEAIGMMEEEKESCFRIGQHGLELILEISRRKKGSPVNILTHCNAGWLACIDYGTATSPIYLAHDQGIKVHVWVDETRPRNQGARLTAWEFQQKGIDVTLLCDSAAASAMARGWVTKVVVGADRIARNGDVANKIGTFPLALAAREHGVPFYVAAPFSTLDPALESGAEIPIEERDGSEVTDNKDIGPKDIF